MQKFIIGILVGVLTDPKVITMIEGLLGKIITERIIPLVPVAIGAAMAEVATHIPGAGVAVDVVRVTEAARNRLNELIPDVDLGIPVLDSLMDFWRPRQ